MEHGDSQDAEIYDKYSDIEYNATVLKETAEYKINQKLYVIYKVYIILIKMGVNVSECHLKSMILLYCEAKEK